MPSAYLIQNIRMPLVFKLLILIMLLSPTSVSLNDNITEYDRQINESVRDMWSIPGWYSLGGYTTSNPDIAAFQISPDVGDRQYSVAVRGGDESLWYRGWDQSYDLDWFYQGGMIVGDPIVFQAGDELWSFARGKDDALWVHLVDGWHSLGGKITSNPFPIFDANKFLKIDVFVRGSDGALWLCEFDPTTNTGQWRSFGGFFNGNPYAVWDGVGKTRVFVRGGDNSLWNLAYDSVNPFSYWWPLFGIISSDPKPVASLSESNGNIIGTFARGQDGALWMNIYDSDRNVAWWEGFGGFLSSGYNPEPVMNNYYNFIDIYGRGGDGALWRKQVTVSGDSLGDWISLGGYINSNPSGAWRFGTASGTFVAVRGNDNSLWINSNDDD